MISVTADSSAETTKYISSYTYIWDVNLDTYKPVFFFMTVDDTDRTNTTVSSAYEADLASYDL